MVWIEPNSSHGGPAGGSHPSVSASATAGTDTVGGAADGDGAATGGTVSGTVGPVLVVVEPAVRSATEQPNPEAARTATGIAVRSHPGDTVTPAGSR